MQRSRHHQLKRGHQRKGSHEKRDSSGPRKKGADRVVCATWPCVRDRHGKSFCPIALSMSLPVVSLSFSLLCSSCARSNDAVIVTGGSFRWSDAIFSLDSILFFINFMGIGGEGGGTIIRHENKTNGLPKQIKTRTNKKSTKGETSKSIEIRGDVSYF